MGTYLAIASHLEPRAISPRLFESDRTGQRTDYRRLDLPATRESDNMPALRAPGLFAGGPRPEKYFKRGIQCDAALAVVCFDQRVLRIGVYEWVAGCAVSRELFAATHHV